MAEAKTFQTAMAEAGSRWKEARMVALLVNMKTKDDSKLFSEIFAQMSSYKLKMINPTLVDEN